MEPSAQFETQFESILIAAKALGIPFVLALAGSLWAGMRKHGAAAWLALQGGTAAIVCGFVGGYVAINHEQWQFPPVQAWDWLAPLALGAALILIALEWRGAGGRAWLATQLTLVLLASWAMMPPSLKTQDTLQLVLVWCPLCAVWLALWRHLELVEAVPPRAGVALTLSAGTLGFVVALGGSIMIGCGALSLMGALAGWTLVSLKSGSAPLPRALAGVAVLLFGSIVLAAYFYAELPPSLLAIVACGLPLARWAPRSAAGRPWRDLALGIAASAPPLTVAIGMSVWSYLHQPKPY